MVLEALERGLGCPFADEGHDLAAIGSEPLRRRKGAGKAFGCVVGGLLPPVCSLLPA